MEKRLAPARLALIPALALGLAACQNDYADAPMGLVVNTDGSGEVLTPLCEGDIALQAEFAQTANGETGGYAFYQARGAQGADRDGILRWDVPAVGTLNHVPDGWDVGDVRGAGPLTNGVASLGSIWVRTESTSAHAFPLAMGVSAGSWLVTWQDGEYALEKVEAGEGGQRVLAWCRDFASGEGDG